MEINVTFFIQVINFFITYKILDKFLLRSVVNSLQEEKNKRHKLANEIKRQEEGLITLEKEKVHTLKLFQESAKEHYPNVSFVVPQVTCIKVEKKESESDTVKLQKEITKLLVSRIPHAY